MASKTILLNIIGVILGGFLNLAFAQEFPDTPNKDIIDIHVHGVCASEANGCYISPAMRRSLLGLKFKLYARAYGLTTKDIEEGNDWKAIEHLHKLVDSSRYISKAVVLAHDGVIKNGLDGKTSVDYDKTDVLISNAFILRETKKYDNLLYGPSINPDRNDAVDQLKQAKEDGAVLVKWIPCVMFFDPADKDHDAFYETLVDLNLPLLSHVGEESSFVQSKDEYCDPLRLQRALDHGVTIIAPHIASRGEHNNQSAYDRLQYLWNKYPNLYTDNSATLLFNRESQFLLNANLDERVLYGSDYPLLDMSILFFKLQNPKRFYKYINSAWQAYIENEPGNPLDKDIALKKAMGMPEASFYTSRQLLGID